MRTRHRFLITLAALIALAVLITLRHVDREPEYQGLKLSQWLSASDPAYPDAPIVSAEGQEAIRQMGTNAIPPLLHWIAYEQSTFRRIVVSPIVRLRPSSASSLRDPRMRQAFQATQAFGILGPAARSAVPELARLSTTSRDHLVTLRCLEALTSIGPESVPGLITIISNTNAHARFFAITDLPQFGAAARPAIPALIACLGDKDPTVASGAAEALGLLGTDAPTVVPALTILLQSTNPHIRSAAARSLKRFGQPTAPDVITNTPAK